MLPGVGTNDRSAVIPAMVRRPIHLSLWKSVRSVLRDQATKELLKRIGAVLAAMLLYRLPQRLTDADGDASKRRCVRSVGGRIRLNLLNLA